MLEECKVRRYCPPVLLDTTLPAPPRPISVPDDAQWVAGETGGSWFQLMSEGNGIRLQRFCPEGVLECTILLHPSNGHLHLTSPFRIVPMSHCAEVRAMQMGSEIILMGQ